MNHGITTESSIQEKKSNLKLEREDRTQACEIKKSNLKTVHFFLRVNTYEVKMAH